MAETIYSVPVSEQFLYDRQKYAIALCRKQAVPDVKDGLKSVHRRVLYGMKDKHLTPSAQFAKSALVVGHVMGVYHPHGDSSIYGVMVSMAQWWKYKSVLVQGQGNWGTIQGDPEAASRYTECKLSPFANDCFFSMMHDSGNGIVDWVPTYNDINLEPEYLPCVIPNLLINGTMGIALGLKVEIPTHNINDVIDATIAVLKDPNAPVVLIPDHCQQVDIVDTNWKQICNAGLGTYRSRGRINISENEKGEPEVIIKSVPNGVTISTPSDPTKGVIGTITTLHKEGKLPMIKSMLDETDESIKNKYNQLNYIITLKKGSDPVYFKNLLYKKTALESTHRVNFQALDGIELDRYSYKSYIEYWIKFSMMLKFRSYAAKYQKTKTTWQELQLYIRLMESGEIDAVKDKISKCKDVTEAGRQEIVEWIIKKFNVTDTEAEYIVRMNLFKLAIGFLPKYKQQCLELEKQYGEYILKMYDDNILKEEIISDLLMYKEKYGSPRTSRVIKDKGNEIPEGTFKIIITENNYIKRVIETEKAITVRGDAPKFILTVDNAQSILLFNRLGKVFKLPVHLIPLCANNNSGTDLRLLIKGCTSDIISAIYEPTLINLSKLVKKQHLLLISDLNCIKRIELDDIINVPPSGIMLAKLGKNDFIKDLTIIPESGVDIVVYTAHKALRMKPEHINIYKRTAMGDKCMDTTEELGGLSILSGNHNYIITVTKSGKVNKILTEALPIKGRNKAPSNIIKLDKTDSIFGIYNVSDDDSINITDSDGTNIIKVSDIKMGSSVSMGVKLAKNVFKAFVQ